MIEAIVSRFVRGWRAVGASNKRVLIVDVLCLALAVYVGFAMRLTLLVSPAFRPDLAVTVLIFAPCVLLAMWGCGVYRIFWPQGSVDEYARLVRGYIYGCALFLVINYFLRSLSVPRTSLAIMLLAGIVFTGAVRVSWRMIGLQRSSADKQRLTIIIGAGEAGAFLARDLQRNGGDLAPVGFIDDDADKRGKIIAGLPVLGDGEKLAEIVRNRAVEVVLIAIPSAAGPQMKHYLDALSPLSVQVRVLPSLRDLAGGAIEVSRLRSISLEDLLRREPIQLDLAGIDAAVRGKRILVTGAGGSIGSEICRQLVSHAPSELILLGHGEQSIYQISQALDDEGVTIATRRVIADTADLATMDRIFAALRPQVVFHAAAHKHVPLMEENPRESLRVNGLGTWNLARLSGETGVERFVMISSDKAVNPSSVMGATKRIAERLIREAQLRWPGTSYMAVRFGNVLGSRGSVVPRFEEQIARGGPVTVTHHDMKRYFMLIPEAVALVLQAGSMGRGGELYVLDMGEPIKIADMAETLIRLHGHEPYTEIPIVETGRRPGEKLYEELFYDPAHVDLTSHNKIFLTRLDTDEEGSVMPRIEELLKSDAPSDEIRSEIFNLALGA